MNRHEIVVGVAEKLMPESRSKAFARDVREAGAMLSNHGAIELIGTLQDMIGTPYARQVAHEAISKLRHKESA